MADFASDDDHTDAELIAASCVGNLAAFERQYRRHHARIYALCWQLCGNNAHQAEDLQQEPLCNGSGADPVTQRNKINQQCAGLMCLGESACRRMEQ